MIKSAALKGSHLRAYNSIFQHPLAHNLEWHDVHAMLNELCHVDKEANGNLKVTRNGQELVLHPPRSKDVEGAEEMMALRHFLERSEAPESKAMGANLRT